MTSLTLAERREQQSISRCKSREALNPRGGGVPSDGNELMEKILADLRSTTHMEVLKRVRALPEIRRGKVLNIRCQITQGTYKVSSRLERVIDLTILTEPNDTRGKIPEPPPA